MQIERFIKDCGSLGGQKRALAEAKGRELREAITPAAALAFGVVPLGEHGGSLVLAAVPGAHPDCEAALSAALGRPVALVRFDEVLIREAISRLYLGSKPEGPAVDLQTFTAPDFLRDAGAAKALLSEKSGALPEEEIRLPDGRMAFLDLRVHSILKSLDVKRRIEFAQTKSMLPFRLEGNGKGGAVLFREKPPSDDVKAIISQAIFYDGDEHVQAVVSVDLTKLPHMIHPSELQLAGLAGKEARLWVYDRIETVHAGRRGRGRGGRPAASWEVKYYFLRFGARFERTLRLDVLAFALVERSKVRLAKRSDRLAPADLDRVFGLDFARG